MMLPRLSAARLLQALRHDRRGAAAVFLAVALVPMAGAVGLAIDSSLGYMLRTRLSKSLDAAGLASGRVALDDNAEDVARDFFYANFGATTGGVEVTDVGFELDETMHFVTLTAEATMPTYFMRVFGQEEMRVRARTVIERETTGMELALVMDNTGSMWDSDTKTDIAGTPFEAMRDAALDLIDIIYDENEELDNVWVSLVPFVATVNVGTGRTGWLDPTDQIFKGSSPFTAEAWKGCVMARAYPYDGDDTPPATQPFFSYAYPKTSTDNAYPPVNSSYKATNAAAKGPNLACGSAITPLTKSRTAIEAGINEMKPWRRGGTAGNIGLAWGWRTISPRWRGLWGEADLPLDYGTDYMDKVVVLLTDGNNEFYNLPFTKDKKGNVTSPGDETTPSDYTAYGRVNAPGPVGLAKSAIAGGREVLDARMLETCAAMKAQKIRIYTIIFGDRPTPETKELYEACATSTAMYHYAPSNADLAKAFRKIGGQLANLMIVE
jgi:Flp pilus assembly protein TadG